MEKIHFQQIFKNLFAAECKITLESQLLQLCIVLLHRQGNITFFYLLKYVCLKDHKDLYLGKCTEDRHVHTG